MATPSLKTRTLCEVPLKWTGPNEQPLDILSEATPRRFRLIDCVQLTQNKLLRIVEFPDYCSVRYAAISYVWRGNAIDPTYTSRVTTFGVVGAEDADPISVDVLNHTCITALHNHADYLWLDRLCIMQTSRDDKVWQIEHMYEYYKSCGVCIVLPGGLQRIVRLDEETAWIHRGWTLQETLAPEHVVVLFAWKAGPGHIVSLSTEGAITEVISSQSAISAVANIVNGCAQGYAIFIPRRKPRPSKILRFQIRIFGRTLPNLLSLSAAMDKLRKQDWSRDMIEHAIWKCAMMRTSSRPVDMIFSIMGLFGVVLDTRTFGKNDRLGATIALAKQILRKGGSASWLGASIHLPPHRSLSTFPVFPQTSVSGKALVRTEDGLQEAAMFMNAECPTICMPNGSMDDDGYFTFSGPSVLVERKEPQLPLESADTSLPQVTNLETVDGTVWVVCNSRESETSASDSRTFAVVLGQFGQYRPPVYATQTLKHHTSLRLMLIEEHEPGKFHLVDFCTSEGSSDDLPWKTRTFSVGGPLTLTQDMDQIVLCNRLSPSRMNRWVGTERLRIAEAEEALSQAALERLLAVAYLQRNNTSGRAESSEGDVDSDTDDDGNLRMSDEDD
ncbi:hypothetical protein BKA93DRAFT_750023 [Sparassis latifolia]